MKRLIILFLIIVRTTTLTAQDDILKKEIEIEAKNHIQNLLDGNINAYIKNYDKNYIHIDGGRNKDGSINLSYEKRRLKKLYRNGFKHYKGATSKDSITIREHIKIVNYQEAIDNYKWINNYGFELQKKDYFILLRIHKQGYKKAMLVGVYRKLDNQWKIVAGDF